MFRFYKTFVPVMFSIRFMCLISHLVLLVLLILDRAPNTNKFLERSGLLANEYSTYESEYTIWLSVSIGILGLEMISFLFTISSLVIYQSFISVLTHSIGVFVIFGFYTEAWVFRDIRWVLGFCTAIPFLTEFLAYIDVFVLKKTHI